jgi:hypothetical protein
MQSSIYKKFLDPSSETQNAVVSTKNFEIVFDNVFVLNKAQLKNVKLIF